MKEVPKVATTCSNDILPRCTSPKMGESATQRILLASSRIAVELRKQGHGYEVATPSTKRLNILEL